MNPKSICLKSSGMIEIVSGVLAIKDNLTVL